MYGAASNLRPVKTFGIVKNFDSFEIYEKIIYNLTLIYALEKFISKSNTLHNNRSSFQIF